jgi:hypothetical protein
MRRHYLLNNRFGKLTVVGLGTSQCKNTKWVCQCDCGSVIEVFQGNLITGRSRSCGCDVQHVVRRGSDRDLHGSTQSDTYESWKAMKERCFNPNNSSFPDYGGRNITVAPEWVRSFSKFLADMGERPSGTTLDRIDPNGNYCKENCRWATLSVQNRNRRSSVVTKLARVFAK